MRLKLLLLTLVIFGTPCFNTLFAQKLDVLFTRYYSAPNVQYFSGSKITSTSKHQYLITASSKEYADGTDPLYKEIAWLISVNRNGDTNWTFRLRDTTPLYSRASGLSAIEYSDGNLLFLSEEDSLKYLIKLTQNGEIVWKRKLTRLLARTDEQGKVATAFAPVVNATSKLKPARVVMEKVTGIGRDRLLPTFVKERFSTWFKKRPLPARGEAVALFPTCLVEYQEPAIGKAMVGVLERNRYRCALPEGQVCCGMPWLDAGDVDKFRKAAQKNVDALLPAVDAGMNVLVPQPTCAYTLKDEYPAFLGTDEARRVAAATFDAAEFLMNRHRDEMLDTNFAGTTYEKIVWHSACHQRAQQIGPKSAQLMRLTGAEVDVVERCSAIDGTWGLRAENVEMARKIAKPLMEKVSASDAELVTGDCQLANVAMTEGTGKRPVHPLQVLARAYGIEEPS